MRAMCPQQKNNQKSCFENTSNCFNNLSLVQLQEKSDKIYCGNIERINEDENVFLKEG